MCECNSRFCVGCTQLSESIHTLFDVASGEWSNHRMHILICEEMRQFIAKFSHTNHLSGGIQHATQCMIPILTISQVVVSLLILKMLNEM
jgi:hypothetical protein